MNVPDVGIDHLEKLTLSFARVSVVAQGPLFAAVHAEVAYGASRIWVTISLDTGDWQAPSKSTEHPLSVQSAATYERSSGTCSARRTKNTTWAMIKLEVCAYEYADLISERRSKYHSSCLGDTLLRAAPEPNADQDQRFLNMCASRSLTKHLTMGTLSRPMSPCLSRHTSSTRRPTVRVRLVSLLSFAALTRSPHDDHPSAPGASVRALQHTHSALSPSRAERRPRDNI
ncbi:hypothetical protein B0H15DRAFT_1010575 [Mycena belliarum]|uniref:Uncharacterized protein n=1 Tax=Mycena belliarum TaxID=1033014 RepID=A0AAD6XJI3_9AGAR|nr:hypothetical protein B0H15DRAFT_1010575 [Mycena belliae]